ncbi:putative steroid dehydrogenase [Aspergillus unguis]
MGGTKHFNVEGQSVIIAGGSKGLGREIALQLTAQGANITILARSPGPLEQTRQELLKHTKSPSQTITATALDLTSANDVESYISSLETTPAILFCVSGGAADEIGFFADITPSQIQASMSRNFYSQAFIANALFRRWVKEPVSAVPRHLIFTASTAALLGIPGYAAYTPAKAATRGLADTLRAEALLYASQQEIRVHCSFPGTFYSEGFSAEQVRKPALTKKLEGTEEDKGGIPAARVAELTIKGLQEGRFLITSDGDTELLVNNMRGPSPRDSPVKQWVLGVVASLVWPFYRRSWDKETREYGKSLRG